MYIWWYIWYVIQIIFGVVGDAIVCIRWQCVCVCVLIMGDVVCIYVCDVWMNPKNRTEFALKNIASQYIFANNFRCELTERATGTKRSFQHATGEWLPHRTRIPGEICTLYLSYHSTHFREHIYICLRFLSLSLALFFNISKTNTPKLVKVSLLTYVYIHNIF